MWCSRYPRIVLPLRSVCTRLPRHGHPCQTVGSIRTSTRSVSLLPLTCNLQTVRGGRGAVSTAGATLPSRRSATSTESGTMSTAAEGDADSNVDLSVPTASSWSSEGRMVYENLVMELTGPDSCGGWEKKVHLVDVNVPAKEPRLMTRCDVEQTGNFFNYAMFVNKNLRVLRGVIEFGPYLQGPPLCAHGGALATLADSGMGSLVFSCGMRSATVNLSIDYKNFVLLGKPYLYESSIDSIEGRKVRTSLKLMPADDRLTVCLKASALFLRAMEAQSGQALEPADLARSKKPHDAKL